MTPPTMPMSDDRLDRLIRDLATERADAIFGTVLPADAVADRIAGRVGSRRLGGSRGWLLAAAALLALLVGVLVVGSELLQPTRLVVDPSPPPDATVAPPTPSAGATRYAFSTELIVIPRGTQGCPGQYDCARSTVVAVDLATGTSVDLYPRDGNRSVVALSPDGSRLVINDNVDGLDRNVLVRVEGSPPTVADSQVLSGQLVPGPDCQSACFYGEGWGFSPDGGHLAFILRSKAASDEAGYADSVVAILDLTTDTVTRLDATASSWPEGMVEHPRWSFDGSQLTYTRSLVGYLTGTNPIEPPEVFVVDADGTDLHALVPTELGAVRAEWAPDRALILFTGTRMTFGLDGALGGLEGLTDLYTVLPDGSDLRRLTRDGLDLGAVDVGGHSIGSHDGRWTADGGIVYFRLAWAPGIGSDETAAPEVWWMDADGSNQRPLGSDLRALTDAGCVVCPYEAPLLDGDIPDWAFWQPRP